MVKTFSFKAFISVTLIHLFGTFMLIDAGFAEVAAMKRALATEQPEESFVWLTVSCWICQPLEMFFGRVLHVDSNNYLLILALGWSIVVGACFGVLVPLLFRRRRRVNL